MTADEIENLVRSGRIACAWGPALTMTPWPDGLSPAGDRWRGMFLGLAIGDSLGNTSESRTPAQRRADHGEIRTYLPHRYAGGRRVGLPSDDTQLCAWGIEQILRDGRFDPEAYLALLSERQIFGCGQTIRDGLKARRRGLGWLEASQPSAGNGALMRCPAVFANCLVGDGAGLGLQAALFAATTHNDLAAVSSAVAFTQMLAELLVMEWPPEPRWWVARYVELAAPLEGTARYRGRGAPRGEDYEGSVWAFVQREVERALTMGLEVREACDGWYSGAYLLETMPSVLFILTKHAQDPVEAIVRAVNDTRDNDTIAAVVGAAVGALHGESALPELWRKGLLGRTREADDGELFRLLDAVHVRNEQFRSLRHHERALASVAGEGHSPPGGVVER